MSPHYKRNRAFLFSYSSCLIQPLYSCPSLSLSPGSICSCSCLPSFPFFSSPFNCRTYCCSALLSLGCKGGGQARGDRGTSAATCRLRRRVGLPGRHKHSYTPHHGTAQHSSKHRISQRSSTAQHSTAYYFTMQFTTVLQRNTIFLFETSVHPTSMHISSHYYSEYRNRRNHFK
jgi:hypothetical protein